MYVGFIHFFNVFLLGFPLFFFAKLNLYFQFVSMTLEDGPDSISLFFLQMDFAGFRCFDFDVADSSEKFTFFLLEFRSRLLARRVPWRLLRGFIGGGRPGGGGGGGT